MGGGILIVEGSLGGAVWNGNHSIDSITQGNRVYLARVQGCGGFSSAELLLGKEVVFPARVCQWQ